MELFRDKSIKTRKPTILYFKRSFNIRLET